jgi:hypothetical protein
LIYGFSSQYQVQDYRAIKIPTRNANNISHLDLRKQRLKIKIMQGLAFNIARYRLIDNYYNRVNPTGISFDTMEASTTARRSKSKIFNSIHTKIQKK